MNIQQMMKQAQSMQKKMQVIQSKMDEMEIVGTAGGEVVTVTMTGKNQVKKIKIDKTLINHNDIEILEDLIVAALNNARQKVEQANQEEMNKLGVSPEIMKSII